MNTIDFTELEPDDSYPVDEWVCGAVINGDRCPSPVGWSLTEVDDTYDSGFERGCWWPTWVTSDGGVRVCEDCSMHLEDPDLDPDSTTELAKEPTQ